MTELLVLFAFSFALLFCIFSGQPIFYALLFGYFLFFSYGLFKKHSFRELLSLSFSGILTIKNVLMAFLLIGMLTAVWRACGTIPFIVYYTAGFLSPAAMLLITFLLCCLVSFLTGTSFGTAATIGIVCMTVASGMGIPAFFTGGAILSGAFFGDRCSPVSTSALLVSELTKTDLYKNIRRMISSSVLPFLLTCFIYLAAGFFLRPSGASNSLPSVFQTYFTLHPVSVLPALLVFIFSLLHIDIKITLAVSTICGSFLACFLENMPLKQLFSCFLFGYHPSAPNLASVLSGGGILSMVNVFCIVCLSSCYSGLFKGTGFLDEIQTIISKYSRKHSAFLLYLLTSICTGLISCNQTLTIMMAHQLCETIPCSKEEHALCLENTAVIISPLIPWSIAGATPLATVGAPLTSLAFASYLYLLPLCCLFISDRR